MGRYAKKTTVQVSASRQEIYKILVKWGANRIQWDDDLASGETILRFAWAHDGAHLAAQFRIQCMTTEEMKAEAVDKRNGAFSQSKFRKLYLHQGRVEHRELALFLKAAFVAVEAGIIKAEQVFLPFLVNDKGRTISELVLPQLKSGDFKLLGEK